MIGFLMQFLLIVSLVVLSVIPLWFIYHKVYKDGVIGRFALAWISFNAIVILGATFLDGWTYDLPKEIVFLIAALAGFLVWHLYRFEARVVMNKKAQEGVIDRRRLLT